MQYLLAFWAIQSSIASIIDTAFSLKLGEALDLYINIYFPIKFQFIFFYY